MYFLQVPWFAGRSSMYLCMCKFANMKENECCMHGNTFIFLILSFSKQSSKHLLIQPCTMCWFKCIERPKF